MEPLIVSLVGIGVLIVGCIIWVSAGQLKAANRNLQSSLMQISVRDGRLEPAPDQAMTGALRGGFIQRKNPDTKKLEVVTSYVLSDDATTI